MNPVKTHRAVTLYMYIKGTVVYVLFETKSVATVMFLGFFVDFIFYKNLKF